MKRARMLERVAVMELERRFPSNACLLRSESRVTRIIRTALARPGKRREARETAPSVLLEPFKRDEGSEFAIVSWCPRLDLLI